VRFLWRWARSFLRRLCLLIFALRRFFSEPIEFVAGLEWWSVALMDFQRQSHYSITPTLQSPRSTAVNIRPCSRDIQ
jgi:hypothetical protein